MVDNAWRDSFQIKVNKSRLAREDHQAVEREDNTSLLELERRTNQAKPSGGDGLFAGTSFETPEPAPQTNLIKSGLTMSASRNSGGGVTFAEGILTTEEEAMEETNGGEGELVGGKKESKRVTIINRATAALEDLAERLGSSGGSVPGRRKGSKDQDDREKSTDGGTNNVAGERRSAGRVKSVVSKLSKATSRRKTRHAPMGENGFDEDGGAESPAAEPDSMYVSENPQFARAHGIAEED